MVDDDKVWCIMNNEQPQPQRCENGCTRYEKAPENRVALGYCHIDNKHTIYLYYGDLRRISICGCASFAIATPAPAPKQPIQGCWYYDHNVCGLPHPSPVADEHNAAIAAQARKDGREKVLDDIAQYIEKHTWSSADYRSNMHVVTKRPLMDFIQSLRGDAE